MIVKCPQFVLGKPPLSCEHNSNHATHWLKISRAFKNDLYLYLTEWIISILVNLQIFPDLFSSSCCFFRFTLYIIYYTIYIYIYIYIYIALHDKCPYSKLFWSVFHRIRTRITPNTDTFV